jgi:selenocysteine lyase/cysteine desulfurase
LSPLPIPEARRLFSPETVYLNTAAYGLPPRPAFEALQAALDEWRHGRTGYQAWQRSVEASRAGFARMVGVETADVAVGSQVSAFCGLVALSVPRGARVVAAEDDFTSVLFPLLAVEERGVRVDLVPLDRLAEAVDGDTDVVAVSAVQSADGRLADLDAIAAAAAAHRARTFIDATQACGWLPFDAARFDYVACATYKWLLAPRGCAFMTVRDAAAERLTPHLAGWFAAEEPAASYGGPLRLAPRARRLDISPAWFSWVAQSEALDVLERVGIAAIHDHDVALANRFRRGLGWDESDSAIVSVPRDEATVARLDAAGVQFADHGSSLRFSFHLYTEERDVDRALEAMVGEGADRPSS